MEFPRNYLKKTITEAEIRVRVLELESDYTDRLAQSVSDDDWGAACHYAGVLRGLRLTLGLAACYFENIDSQRETDRAVRAVLKRGER